VSFLSLKVNSPLDPGTRAGPTQPVGERCPASFASGEHRAVHFCWGSAPKSGVKVAFLTEHGHFLAMLSFVYTLLTHDKTAALETVGLDPAVGYLYVERPGRPSLALDLVEELRRLSRTVWCSR